MVCLALLLMHLTARSQSPGVATDWVVDNWQTEDGLPQNSVSSVLQTRDGYLWVGTANGLTRFDGVRFTVFRTADHPGLRSNRILCLFEDAHGMLWIGTEGGGLTSYHDGQFAASGTAEGLSSDTVLCLGEDEAGQLWVGTDSGLNLRRAGRFATFFKTDGLSDDRVNAICQPRGAPLVISTGNGLCQYRHERFGPLQTGPPIPAQTTPSCLLDDRDGWLWMGDEVGLYRLPPPGMTNTESPALTSFGGVLSLLERRNLEVWFGTRSGNLCRAVPGGRTAGAEVIWRTQRPVTALCEDVEGNIWIGTAGDGLHRLKRRQLRLVAMPESAGANGAASFFLSPQGELRFVAGNKGLYGWQGGRFVLLSQLPLPNGVGVQAVCQGGADAIWVGTARDGLFECGTNGARQYSERDGLSDSAIEVLRVAADGGLWIGTRNGGLNHFKDRKATRFNTPWGFSGNCACALEQDAEGNLWIGTTGDGLFRLSEGRFTAYAAGSGLPSLQIRALHADDAGSLWVGTDKGLCRVKAGRVTAFTSEYGLSEEPVLQLQSDEVGNLWAGSVSRIFRVNKQQLEDAVEGRTPFVSAVGYGKEDGLPGIQCLPRVQSQGPADRRSGVWFATTKGLVVVDQTGRPWNRTPPPVVLEAVFVDNASVPFDSGVRVPPGKGNLRFEYTALSLTAPGKVNFRYRLDGFDAEWSERSTIREVRYPKVPPGDYRFRVVACNHEGVWNEIGAALAIVVVPFWWNTFWFRISVLATVLVTVVGLYRLRQSRRREIERLRIRIAGDLHDDIGSSLWSITLLSRMLTKHGTLGIEERQDVDEIHRIAVQTSNSIRDIIWLINPAFDTVQDFVARTKDFAGVAMRGVDYRMVCEGADLTRKLPFDFRHNLFLLFKEALTNIVRHANATVVEVRIEEQGNLWQLTIRDNGVGFDPAVSTGGNGLRNLRTRASRMKAALEVRSQPGQGTTIVLTLATP